MNERESLARAGYAVVLLAYNPVRRDFWFEVHNTTDDDLSEISARMPGHLRAMLGGAVMSRDLPYEAVSVSGRALEWKAPLWNAIVEWRAAQAVSDGPRIETACARVEEAVETAMRLAIETHDAHATSALPKTESEQPTSSTPIPPPED